MTTLLDSTNFSATTMDDIDEDFDDIQQSFEPLDDVFVHLIIGILVSFCALLVEVVQVKLYGFSPKKSHRRKLRYENGVKRFRQ